MAQDFDNELIEIFLSGADDMLQLWEEACLEITSDQSPEVFEKLFRSAHNLKGGAGLVGLTNYVTFIHTVEDQLQLHKPSFGEWSEEIIRGLLKVESHLRNWHEKLRTEPSYTPEESLDIPALFGGAAAAKAEASVVKEKPKPQEPAAAAEVPRQDETVRISTSKLDNIIKLMGELSLYQSIIFNHFSKLRDLDHDLVGAADTAAKITDELHAEALSLRMMPLTGLFRRLERLARELSFDLSKPIDFKSSGSDVSLDKLIIEGVSDPLVHIVRNSLDHGLEDLETRMAMGKPSRGQLTISASSEAHGATIIVEDDGGGIDPEKVAQKAISKGLLDESRLEILSRDDKINLIFLPGFSTAEAVTDISGRGVGMDVVKSAVEKLGGNIRLTSVVGEGTSIRIQLPANLSILDALVVQAAGVQFAVPNQDLEEIINLRDFNVQGAESGEPKINLRGSVVPVKRLEKFLGTLCGISEENNQSQPCLIVRTQDSRMAYSIDRIIGQQKIFVRPLDKNLHVIPYISGTTILSDGAPTMILNINELVRDSMI